MHQTIVYGAVGAVGLAVLVWRLIVAIQYPRAHARWAVAIAIACAVVGFEAAIPRNYVWLAEVTGVPNLATWVVYVAVTGAVMAQIVWTTRLTPAGSETSRTAWASGRAVTVVMTVVAAAMGVLFFLAPVHDEVHALDFDDHYATEPLVIAFLAVYLSAFSWANLRILGLCRAWLPHTREHVWLRVGLTFLAVGSVFAVIGYSGLKVVSLAIVWAGGDAYGVSVNVAPAFASLGATLDLVGFGIPSLLPPAIAACSRIRTRTRLRPLRQALLTAFPDVAQSPPAARLSANDTLYLHVIEIRDALLRLQPYLDEPTRIDEITAQAGLPAERHAAAVEAVRITLALSAFRAGGLPSNHAQTFRSPQQPTLDGELQWLTAVAKEFARSGLIASVLADLEQQQPTTEAS